MKNDYSDNVNEMKTLNKDLTEQNIQTIESLRESIEELKNQKPQEPDYISMASRTQDTPSPSQIERVVYYNNSGIEEEHLIRIIEDFLDTFEAQNKQNQQSLENQLENMLDEMEPIIITETVFIPVGGVS